MNRIVKTENGFVRGAASSYPLVTAFKGIPFAAPPVGKNRWRVPQPAANWEGIRDCYTFAPAAMQQRPHADFENMYIREFYVDPDFEQSEDCLYLNVWTPSVHFNDRLPVIVWYHGGGMQGGYTSEMEFTGEHMAKRGVVFVSIAYRLGVFGYLAHPEITAEGKANGEGYANFGLHDQRAGLTWVKRNIAAFGGDPDAITISGQSAGGRSVLFHSMTPYTKPGDFHRVISQSGVGIPYFGYDYPELSRAEEEGGRFFASLGVENLDQARQIDAETLRIAGVRYTGMRWGVCVDGDFIPEHPCTLLAEGKFQKVPMLCGCTQKDAQWLAGCGDANTLAGRIHQHFPIRTEKILALCREAGEDLEAQIAQCNVNIHRFGYELLARRLADFNEDTYLYFFDSDMPGDEHGAFHSAELWFVFETLQLCWRPFEGRHYELARKVCNYWTNFVKNGNPNGLDHDAAAMPVWRPYTQAEPFVMHLSDVPHMETQKQPQAVYEMLDEACAALWHV